MQARSEMPHRRQGLFTAMAAILFCAGVVLLFVALYHQGAWGALVAAAVLFAGTVICWICSAISAPPAR
jgi:hypothetical protein